jgi:hypothetical protein
MNVEIFTLCDAATMAGGKLNVLGSFDNISAMSFPCQHPYCCVATRMRFDVGEEGRHAFEIHFCDPDMRPVLGPVRQSVEIKMPNDRSAVHFHIWNILGFSFTGPGEYYLELRIDEQPQVRIPLYVTQHQPSP